MPTATSAATSKSTKFRRRDRSNHLRGCITELEGQLSAIEVDWDAVSRRANTVEDVFLQLEAKNDELVDELLVWQSGQYQALSGMNTEKMPSYRKTL